MRLEINTKIFRDFMNLRKTTTDFKTLHDTSTHFKRFDETYLDFGRCHKNSAVIEGVVLLSLGVLCIMF